METGAKTGARVETGVEEPYVSYVRALSLWPDTRSSTGAGLSRAQWADLMGGTAERIYGAIGG